MAIEIQDEKGLLVIRISGLATKADAEQWEGAAVGAIKLYGKANGLVLLDDFGGWEKSDAWEDISFVAEFGDKIEKIALVGDPKWKDEMYAFTGKPFRQTQIEFFELGQEAAARKWLG